MRKLLIVTLILIGLVRYAFAGDSHHDGETHTIVYTVEDTSGNPVAGQTVRTAIRRMTDGAYWDWSSSTFKTSGWTTQFGSMSYDSTLGAYFKVISIDQVNTISGDYVVTVSNDDATYGDTQSESFSVDNINNLIKVHR